MGGAELTWPLESKTCEFADESWRRGVDAACLIQARQSGKKSKSAARRGCRLRASVQMGSSGGIWTLMGASFLLMSNLVSLAASQPVLCPGIRLAGSLLGCSRGTWCPCRRRCGVTGNRSRLEREGARLTTIRDLLGHSSVAATDRYLRRIGAGEAQDFARGRVWHAPVFPPRGEVFKCPEHLVLE